VKGHQGHRATRSTPLPVSASGGIVTPTKCVAVSHHYVSRYHTIAELGRSRSRTETLRWRIGMASRGRTSPEFVGLGATSNELVDPPAARSKRPQYPISPFRQGSTAGELCIQQTSWPSANCVGEHAPADIRAEIERLGEPAARNQPLHRDLVRVTVR
jgi:hypothetical protein